MSKGEDKTVNYEELLKEATHTKREGTRRGYQQLLDDMKKTNLRLMELNKS